MLRRHFLQTLPLVAAAVSSVPKDASSQAAGPTTTLVAYFSRTGNTRVIANQIHRAKDAVLFEINPAVAYPEDYEETVAQASRETATGYLPTLAASVPDTWRYGVIYLGFPIWGMTAPPVIRSFVQALDLSGKALYPFITHGGYGLGNSIDVLNSLAPGSELKPAFSMEADQERRTLEQVRGWLRG
ncbi:flavodoxin [Rhizobium sp. BK313]|uniref:flavodoxin n=1 Tax=Rhizobium sp. BK313 TaxID=2587081 RepID=UPI0010EA2461|nr:flavodoxin [Rhizobium sp. BK313]MBB3458723.1 flavodoxin [Rhizobium sp. BK313]